jgi:ribonuclease VapC
MAEVVLDSSALLAFLWEETGTDVVADCIGDAIISAVNFAETIGKLVSRGSSPETARSVVGIARPDIVDFDRELAEQAGILVSKTRRFGLSLGDRACLALAQRERLPVLTADRIWRDLDLGIEIRVIR